MPHLTIQYSQNVEKNIDVQGLCNVMSQAILAQRDSQGNRVFPIGGTRVLAYPAAQYVVADGQGDYGFIYLNFRITAGRPPELIEQVGDALLAVLRAYVNPHFEQATVGYTLQIDEGPEVYDAKEGNLRTLFS